MGTPYYSVSDDSTDERLAQLKREADQVSRVQWLHGELAPSPVLTVRLKYYDGLQTFLNLTGGPVVTAAVYNCNALYKHDNAGSPPENIPPLLEYAKLYNRALVMSAKYKVCQVET